MNTFAGLTVQSVIRWLAEERLCGGFGPLKSNRHFLFCTLSVLGYHQRRRQFISSVEPWTVRFNIAQRLPISNLADNGVYLIVPKQ